jgi:hypothetical protein
MTPAGWGVVVGAVFAAFWGLAGASALPAAWKRRTALVVMMASAGVVARAVIAPPSPLYAMGFRGEIYAGAVVFEALAVGLAAVTLRGRERRGQLAAVIAVITGLHFVGLWLATTERVFLGISLGMAAAGLIALGWPNRPGGPDVRLAIAGFGSALVLWAGCLSSLA